MRTILKVTIVIIFGSSYSFCQPQLPIIWQEVFGGTKNEGTVMDQGYTIPDVYTFNQQALNLDDSGNVYILVNSNSDVSGNKTSGHCGVLSKTDFWLIKLNPLGQKIWEKNLGSDDKDFPGQLLLDTVFRFVYVVGSSKSSQLGCQLSDTSNGFADIWILKLDWNGNVIWSYLYGGPGKELPVASTLLSNGNIMVISASESINGGGDISSSISSAFVNNSWLMSVNANGQINWERWLGSDYCETRMLDLVRVGDNAVSVGYINGTNPNRDVTSGVHYNPSLPGGPQSDGWVIMLDTNGNRLWDRTLGGFNTQEWLISSVSRNNKLYVLGITTAQSISGDITDTLKGAATSQWYVTLDSLGNLDANKIKTCTVTSWGLDMEANNDLLFSLGIANSSGVDNLDSTGGYWIMAMDTLYNVLWSTCINTTYYENNGMRPDFHPTPDSGLVFITTVNDTTYGEFTLPVFDTVNHTSDIWLLKLNPFNTTTGLTETPSSGKAIRCYPNPATTGITVSGLRPSDLIAVQDLSGRNVRQMHLSSTDTSSFVPLSGLLPGLYLIRTTDGVCKAVKQ